MQSSLFDFRYEETYWQRWEGRLSECQGRLHIMELIADWSFSYIHNAYFAFFAKNKKKYKI